MDHDEPTAKRRLLAAAIDHVAAHGVNNLSLRQLATALGTSHRMLIYHFGSKEGLLVEVVTAVEARQREALAEFRRDLETADATGRGAPAEIARRFWRRLTEPDLEPHERLFFEVYGHALQGDPGSSPLLDNVVEAWLDPLEDLMRRFGVPAAEARARARLGLAVTRGLLLDYLATGDRAGVDAAMEAFIATYDDGPVP